MNIDFKKSVFKDILKFPPEARSVIKAQFEALKKVNSLGEMGNVEKMRGTRKPLYRLSVDDVRIMIRKLKDGIQILSVSDRKDAYMKKNIK
jgi:mRNA-degrading endonuclease RelE of RelBE toxin-antitoxin system